MAFGATPKDNVGTPLGSVYTPGTANSDLTALEGGPVTTDSNLQKSAPVSTYTKDGSDLTQGAQADVAYTSGSGSVIAILKGIFNKVAGTLTVSGAVTTSGTVTEANSAASKTDLDNISAVSGVTTDAAVVGDNPGTLSAKQRGLSKIFNDVWDSVNHRLHVNIDNANANGQNTKVNSASVTIASDQSSPASPLTTEASIVSATRQSQAYVVTTSPLTATAGPYMALSLFNPLASGKTITIARMVGWYTTTINHPAFKIYKTASDPSSGWTTPTTVTPINADMGSGNTSVAVCKATNLGQATTLVGTEIFSQDTGANAAAELLGPSALIDLKVPPNSGVVIYINALSTTVYDATIFYMEQ